MTRSPDDEDTVTDAVIIDPENVSAFEPEPRPLPAVYWLTRNQTEGILSTRVQVWAVAPRRERYADGDTEWVAPPEVDDHVVAYIDEWALVDAKLRIGPGVPETSVECLRVGRVHERVA